MNWNKFSMFKMPNKHRRFDYAPRYYDAEKESLAKKIKQAKREKELVDEGKLERDITFKSKIENKWGVNSDYKVQNRRSNLRLIIILGIIIILFYYVFVGLDGLGYLIDENIDKLK